MGKVLYMRKGERHTVPVPFPAGHTKLAYIQSSGTQYIDTGFKPTGSTKVVLDFQMVNQGTTQQGVFGSRPGTSGRFTVFTGTSVSSFQIDYNTSALLMATNEQVGGLNTNNRNVIEVSNELIVNGTLAKRINAVSFSSDYNLWLFANNNAGTAQIPSSMKLYSCKIYDSGALVRDYAPCINPSGAVGLYDFVGKKFYGNAGTGVFTGSEVA